MTAEIWNEYSDFLESCEIGCWAEWEGRHVERVNMAGGRFLLTDEQGDVCGLVYDVWKAMTFLKSGKIQPVEGD